MPTELEELVGFLGSPRPEIRQLALEHAVGYSAGSQSSVFLEPALKPIRDLKVIVNDIPPRAKHALTILVNLSDKSAVLESLISDALFHPLLISKIVSQSYTNADQASMLLANMTKSDSFSKKLIDLPALEGAEGGAASVLDQLMDCFVKGTNPEANYDFLAYVFADVSRLPAGRDYFTKKRDYDGVIPICKLTVFTEHKSLIRRKGVASTIKNCCFDVSSHPTFLNPEEVNLLPYILLPLMGSEEYDDEDMDGMLDDLQLLPPDKARDTDTHILTTHLESLLLLTSTRAGREYMRKVQVYPIIRETHLHTEDDEVAEACDRLVQVLMAERDDAGDVGPDGEVVEKEEEEEDEDEGAMVEIL
ncbi:DNA-binding protein HGH1 [Tricharina praecox]|uniref:DNA-binding protein HGH1 n=1 Tax=Tricharina praecox TaxID=43433 RepID=UPI00221E6E56|nr:DNA-binding protein HGH1 [Tricharina praecox]KAI5848169.1 DNA-binding protein HGH1 [Tricharina praecox]